MFDRNLIVAVVLSFVSVFTINYLFKDSSQPKPQTIQLGANSVAALPVHPNAYKMMTPQELAKPASHDVTFATEQNGAEMLTTIEMPQYQATFTTSGGTLQTLRYPEHTNTQNEPLQAIHPVGAQEREHAPFMVALEKDTPYTFKFDGQEKVENGVQVRYVARADEWNIEKTFLLHNDSYQIDLTIGFVPRSSSAAAIKPRLFVPAPTLPSLARDKAAGITVNDKNNGTKKIVGGSSLQQAWVLPTLFGVENSYFAHVLLKDDRAFAQRGYFKQNSNDHMTAVLEGPQVTDTVSFPLSFYVGPKSLPALRAVDSRLEDLLSFGWLSWLAKLLLQLLQFLYKHVANYGLAIIILTLALKLLLLPFSLKSGSYMATQQKLQPRMAALRKKFGHDQQRLHMEMMALYKEHNVSPMAPMMGCLLALPQFPIFFALYRVLSGSIELYQAPFVGWLTDLSAKDPYYILPLMVGVLAFMQPFAQSKQTDSRAQLIAYLMPIIMIAMFVGLPAGLLLFILFNFLTTLAEQRLRKFISA